MRRIYDVIRTDIRDMFLAKEGKRDIAYAMKRKWGASFKETYKYLKELARNWSFRSEIVLGKVTRKSQYYAPGNVQVRFWVISDQELPESKVWELFQKKMKIAQVTFMEMDFSSFQEENVEYNIRINRQPEEQGWRIKFQVSPDWYDEYGYPESRRRKHDTTRM